MDGSGGGIDPVRAREDSGAFGGREDVVIAADGASRFVVVLGWGAAVEEDCGVEFGGGGAVFDVGVEDGVEVFGGGLDDGGVEAFGGGVGGFWSEVEEGGGGLAAVWGSGGLEVIGGLFKKMGVAVGGGEVQNFPDGGEVCCELADGEECGGGFVAEGVVAEGGGEARVEVELREGVGYVGGREGEGAPGVGVCRAVGVLFF